ncbi:MAG: zeta toxin family protein [Flavobacteriales bacterium]
MPNLYIIAGPNGAGKTTASFTVLPEMLNCKEYVNADEIAKGISPFNPESVSIQAGKVMLQRINQLITEKEDFAFETTLSTKSYVNLIDKAKENGYFVSLLFFWLNDVKLAKQRVSFRVNEGGHNIPKDVIERRYEKGLQNLFNLFIPKCDYWIMIDNSNTPYSRIAEGNNGSKKITVEEESKWNKIKTNYEGK